MTSIAFPSGVQLEVVEGAVERDEEHWDPKSTGNPLLDAGARDVSLSDDFTVGGFAKSGSHRFPIARIDPAFIVALQQLRDFVGKPVRITSGYRSWAYNERIYRRRRKRPTKSRHCCGQAADIKISGMSGLDIAKAAVDACGTKIAVGIGSDFAHIDIRGRWTNWTYMSPAEGRIARKEIRAYRRLRKRNPLPGGQPSIVVPPLPIDLSRAVVRNPFHADDLGWGSRRAEVDALIGIEPGMPLEDDFAEAVADWQRDQDLLVDGILGPVTWARMADVLESSG